MDKRIRERPIEEEEEGESGIVNMWKRIGEQETKRKRIGFRLVHAVGTIQLLFVLAPGQRNDRFIQPSNADLSVSFSQQLHQTPTFPLLSSPD